MKATESNPIVSRIHAAFPKIPMSLELRGSWCEWLSDQESQMLEEKEAFQRYGSRRWDQIEERIVITPFASIHELPHDVFDYYLPRFLVSAVLNPYEVVFECLVTRFVHSSYDFCRFTPDQKESIASVLKFHIESNCFGDDSLRSRAEAALKKLEL